MFQGFYNLTSGMMVQSQKLDVISNNMANAKTPGYKADTYLGRNFREEMMLRTGNVDKAEPRQLGVVSMAKVGDSMNVSFEEGAPEQTDGNLDFAINGNGFFKIAVPGGGFCYTRNGSFSVDQEGMLTLNGVGRVQGQGGDIYLDSDAIDMDAAGILYDQFGEEIDGIEIVYFADYAQLLKGENSTFITNQQELLVENPKVMKGYLEQSNVDVLKETTDMIASQRSIQGAAQLLKMYDTIMGKAVTEIGKV